MSIKKSKVVNMFSEIRLILELCRLDIKQRTAGTSFGVLWIYLNPAISMFMIWFVFFFGLRSSSGAAGVYSLLVGLIAWQLIADVVVIGTGAFTEKPYLVKKIKFPLYYLPIIKVINSLWIHLPFILAAILLAVVSGKVTLLGSIIFLGFFPIILLFLTMLVFLLATIAVFYRDLQSVLGVIMQLAFWATPIIWTVPEVPAVIKAGENLNPLFFIIRIYRYCFLGESFDFLTSALSFGAVTLGALLLTRSLFYKLKDQFADVL